MNLGVNVPEIFEIFKAISVVPEKLFEMMRLDLREMAGDSLTALMQGELTIQPGWEDYERRERESNHRNGSCPRPFTMKGTGEVAVWVTGERLIWGWGCSRETKNPSTPGGSYFELKGMGLNKEKVHLGSGTACPAWKRSLYLEYAAN